MTAHTPAHPIDSTRPRHAGRRGLLLVLAVVLATLMATIAVASAVSSVRDTAGPAAPPAPIPTRSVAVQDDLHPNRGWIAPGHDASAAKPLPWPHGQYSGT